MTKTRWIFQAALIAGSAFFLSSCSWFMGESSDQEVKELDERMSAAKRETAYDNALLEFGKLLTAYDVAPTPVQSKNIGNETADKALPSDVYTMVSTAVGKIGAEVVFIPYDTQYIVNESSTGGVINRIYPEAVLCGGITGFDKDMIEKDRKGEAEGGWAGAQGGAKYSAGEGVSRITLDLSIMDYKTQVFFPQVLASNAILVRKDKFGWGVRAYYMGCGGSFESEVKQKQGVHAGLRLLVELSVLEVLGKYFCVPYWKCIKDGKRDTLMIERLSAQINEMPENQRLIHLKKLLFVHGYRGIDKSRAETDSAELGVISAAMNEKKCSTTAELFMVLWENVPVDAAVARVLKERKFQAEEGRRAAREAAAQAKAQAKAQAEEAARQAAERKQLEEQFIAVTEGGDKLFNAKNYKQALAEYKKAAALNIGQELIQQRIQAAENALAQIQAAENLYRQNLAGGAALLKSGDNAKAAAAYEAALKVRPGDSAAAAGLEAAKKKIKEKNPVGVNKLNEKDWNDDSQ